MKNKTFSKLLTGASLGLLAAILVWILAKFIAPDLFYSIEAKTYDWRVTAKAGDRIQNDDIIEDIIIIDIDGRAVSELGKYSQWSRSYFPKIIDYIKKDGAAVIGLDIIFDKDIHEPNEDINFINSVTKAGNVSNSLHFAEADSMNWRYVMNEEPTSFEWQKFTYTLPNHQTKYLDNQERMDNEFYELLNAGKSVGHVNIQPDIDGIARKIFLFSNFNNHLYPSLAFQMYMDIYDIDSLHVETRKELQLFSGGNLNTKIPIDRQFNMLINYFGDFKTFRYISFYDVLKGEERLPEGIFKDKIVLVGTSLPGLFDLRSIPIQPAFPGVEIHASILYTMLTQNYITQFSDLDSLLFLGIMGILVGIIAVLMTPMWSFIIILILAFVHILTSALVFFETNIWIEIIAPLLTMLVTFSGVYAYRYVTEEKGKKFIKQTFSHFVTKSVVDELLENPDKIKLGGERKECTVFFSDVAGFTTISEQMSPEALVKLLNQYLTEMTNIIFKYDGMLDKYEGDAIMAVFGAPIAHGNHAYKCCAAALEMQETLAQLRDMWGKQGKPKLYARCGINTGQMVVGNMGSETRFDYTVMGDSVNLGARLEPANKEYGTMVMIGENTYEMAKDKIIARQLDLLRVKGKTEPVKVYELIGLTEKGISEKKNQAIQFFEKGMEHYFTQNWETAIKYFNHALEADHMDNPSKRYLRRCEQFLNNPPGESWDGAFTMLTK
jgi:adenylate cyclase